ncbi:MAG TPA: hypothetical protein ENH29_05920 [Bacteroidetes bacterium]|nr:hypothetical protein [Bacteroidota bacterium]
MNRHLIHYPDWQDDLLQMEAPNAGTLEGQVVAVCDEIAQRTHDLEDGLRAKFVTVDEVRRQPIVQLAEEKYLQPPGPGEPDFEYIGRLIKKLINLLVTDVIEMSLQNIEDFYRRKNRFCPFDELIVTFGPELDPLQLQLDRFISKRIIKRSGIEWADDLAVQVIRGLFRAYLNQPQEMQSFPMHKYFSRYVTWQEEQKFPLFEFEKDDRFVRLTADYIAGMTDLFAMKEYERLAGE